MATTVAFRALDDAGKLPDNYVNPITWRISSTASPSRAPEVIQAPV